MPQSNNVTALRQRLKPPPELSPAARKLWTDIVSSWPAGHFVVSDTELLKAFCQAAELRDQALAHIQEHGQVSMSSRGTPVINPMVTALQTHTSQLATLGTKLRITPQSRLTDRKAGQGARTPAGGSKRPWEHE